MRRLGLAFLLLLAAAPARADGKLKVVSTLPSLANLAREIGGDLVEVTSLLKGTVDPHLMDARRSISRPLPGAALLLRNGAGLEDQWLRPAVVASNNPRIQAGTDGDFNASAFVTLRDVPPVAKKDELPEMAAHLHSHPGGDPHFMLNPINGIKIVRALGERLAKLLPAQADTMRKRAANIASYFDERGGDWARQLQGLRGRPFISYHRGWGSLAEWTGLVEVGTVEPKPGVRPTPDQVIALLDVVQSRKVRIILVSPNDPRAVVEQVARDTGAALVTLPDEVGAVEGAMSYEALFDEIVKRFK